MLLKKMAIPLVVLFVMVENMPVAVGSYVQYDRKLDGRIAQGVVSINAFKRSKLR